MDRLFILSGICVLVFAIVAVAIYALHRKMCGDNYTKRDSLMIVCVWFVAAVVANIVWFFISSAF